MFDIQNGVITITRGDTAEIVVELVDYEMQEGDTLLFTARNKVGGLIWCTKESDINVIKLTPADTKNFIPGKGCYDIELHTASGDIYTFVGVTDNAQYNLTVYAEVSE